MKYVLDVNVALKWVLNEVDSTKARRLRDDWRAQIHELLVPDVFPFEAAHALTRAERRRLIGDAVQFWGEIRRIAPSSSPRCRWPTAHWPSPGKHGSASTTASTSPWRGGRAANWSPPTPGWWPRSSRRSLSSSTWLPSPDGRIFLANPSSACGVWEGVSAIPSQEASMEFANIHEAKSQLSKLDEHAMNGEGRLMGNSSSEEVTGCVTGMGSRYPTPYPFPLGGRYNNSGSWFTRSAAHPRSSAFGSQGWSRPGYQGFDQRAAGQVMAP